MRGMRSSPLIWVFGALLCGCTVHQLPPAATQAKVSGAVSRAENLTEHCVDAAHEGIDYFPQKAQIEDARQFAIEYHNTYKLVRFRPRVNTKETLDYVLHQCGTIPPERYPGAQRIAVPVRRFIDLHAAYLGAIEELGIGDRLLGVDLARSASSPALQRRIEAGQIKIVGMDNHSNVELAISLSPDVLFTFYSAYPQANEHPKLREVGVPAVGLADQFEPDPVARAEWIKFFALFFNREADAERIFTALKQRYTALREIARHAQPVTVMVGSGSRDTWFLSGRQNYWTQFLADAGANYFWNDDQSGSLVEARLEDVYDRAAEADFWVNGPRYVPSVSALVRSDGNLATFGPVQRQQVHAMDGGAGRARRSPFADQSLTKPDLVLADLIADFHPDLLPNHRSTYDRRLLADYQPDGKP
jgi:iron complex transport system substrate-binding protein